MRLVVLPILLAAISFGQNTQWREMRGDDLRWAQPNFDDSAWRLGRGPLRTPTTAGYVGGVHWYRATYVLPPGFQGEEVAIGMGPLDDAYEVDVEGVLAGGFGKWEPKPVFYKERHLVLPVPPGVIKGEQVHVAIRRWNWKAQTNNML